MLYTMRILRCTVEAMTERLGISEARTKLGTLVARAVHAHQPTMISRSTTERAVLISEEDYEDLLKLRQDREAATLNEMINAAGRGDLPTVTYDNPEDMYRDLGLAPPHERR